MRKSVVTVMGFVCLTVCLALTGCSRSSKSAKAKPDEISEIKAQLSVIETKLDSVMEKQEMAILEPGSSSGSRQGAYPAANLSNKQVQKALKLAGYDPGVIDGRFGQKTRNAIKEFQRANGLKTDGVAGRETQAHLRDYL